MAALQRRGTADGSVVGDDGACGDEGGSDPLLLRRQDASTGGVCGSGEGSALKTNPCSGSTGWKPMLADPVGVSWMFCSPRSWTKSYIEYEAPLRALEWFRDPTAALAGAPGGCTWSRSCGVL